MEGKRNHERILTSYHMILKNMQSLMFAYVLPVKVFVNTELLFINMLAVTENSLGSYVKFRQAANEREETFLLFPMTGMQKQSTPKFSF